MQRSLSSLPEDSIRRLRKMILDVEIDQKLWLAKADEDSVTVSEAEVDEILDQRIHGLCSVLEARRL